jgi:MbtH protein
MASDAADDVVFCVVINHEEQYSVWPKGKPLPRGWRGAGKEGPKSECLKYIDEAWTDMRPLTLRQEMERDAVARRKTKQRPA